MSEWITLAIHIHIQTHYKLIRGKMDVELNENHNVHTVDMCITLSIKYTFLCVWGWAIFIHDIIIIPSTYIHTFTNDERAATTSTTSEEKCKNGEKKVMKWLIAFTLRSDENYSGSWDTFHYDIILLNHNNVRYVFVDLIYGFVIIIIMIMRSWLMYEKIFIRYDMMCVWKAEI